MKIQGPQDNLVQQLRSEEIQGTTVEIQDYNLIQFRTMTLEIGKEQESCAMFPAQCRLQLDHVTRGFSTAVSRSTKLLVFHGNLVHLDISFVNLPIRSAELMPKGFVLRCKF
jgi:hypothetical protein